MRHITDEKGWRRAKNGKFYSPYIEVRGEWVERSDIEWDSLPDLQPTPSVNEHAEAKRKHQQQAARTKNLSDFVDNGLEVKILQTPHIHEPTGMLCVHLEARFLGKKVDVDDGILQFYGMPDGPDVVQTLKRQIAIVIRNRNGIASGS